MQLLRWCFTEFSLDRQVLTCREFQSVLKTELGWTGLAACNSAPIWKSSSTSVKQSAIKLMVNCIRIRDWLQWNTDRTFELILSSATWCFVASATLKPGIKCWSSPARRLRFTKNCATVSLHPPGTTRPDSATLCWPATLQNGKPSIRLWAYGSLPSPLCFTRNNANYWILAKMPECSAWFQIGNTL